jgi:asparagine synthase (glutamine-hydrolysing)
MLDAVAHRGPDDRGIHVIPGRGVIGNVRLAIMDPEHGVQPLFNEDRRIALVANGEIYNYPLLRPALEARGHRFATGSDNEAIVHLFEDHDSATFSRLDGMFAIAVAGADRLMLARDPIGIKPLYISWNGRTGAACRLRFASELHALTGSPDPVRPLAPGCMFDSERGLSAFFDLALPRPLDEAEETISARLAQTLRESVRSHLMSDVPVGVFLSGGLDSSIVAALMRPHVKELHSFTVGLPGSQDLKHARIVADRLGTIHHEGHFGVDDVVRELPAIARHIESYDRYIASNSIPAWFCSRLAASTVKVALVGEGADELFAGYTYYRSIRDPEVLRRELHRGIADLHQTNLQRVDRMSMAHGVECRVPYITPAVVNLALAIPVHLKVREGRDRGDGKRIGKYILRRTFDGLLPDEIIWGSKRDFDHGSGMTEILGEAVNRAVAGLDTKAYRRLHRSAWLRRDEEVCFHKLLRDAYGDDPAIFDNVARWSKLRLRDPGGSERGVRRGRPWWRRLFGG